jgi:PAS domain S-box-containing protein
MRNIKSENETPLRLQAEGLLRLSAAPKAKLGVTDAKAQAVIYKMASSPASAGDALKIIQELQVHQVELDMQYEQFEQSRNELSQTLDRYVELYDFAPFAYFTVDRDGKIIEGNRAAAELSGVEQAVLSGGHIDGLVTSQCQLAIRALLKRLCSGGSRETCEAQVDSGNFLRHFQIVASASPSGQSIMMVFIETTDRKKPDPAS